ncbi:FtsH protease modulator YccA [Corallincola luteus]|uniref:FtsH protease modulator YccA n=2 Tax=Corallincola TaxID=1775176 RepID=A0A368NQJ4_9GAMM|nr:MULTISPECIES: Bax inhibitor-1 family protein [Corallincola]RCU52837.1 FtsH protease modulator YccA [Corallincola holothuriorum]TCI03336.1 FtsH protease modulator YccA [Corallincola luteus]
MSVVSTASQGVIQEQNKVLKNTFFMVGLQFATAAAVGVAATLLALPPVHWIIFLAGFYGLSFMVEKNRYNMTGFFCALAAAGLLGYASGPIISMYLAVKPDAVFMALAMTGLSMFGLSLYATTTKKDLNLLGGAMSIAFWVLLGGVVLNIFMGSSLISLMISGGIAIFSGLAIMMTIQAIIRGGETSYVSASLTIFVGIYNIFMFFLRFFGSDD